MKVRKECKKKIKRVPEYLEDTKMCFKEYNPLLCYRSILLSLILTSRYLEYQLLQELLGYQKINALLTRAIAFSFKNIIVSQVRSVGTEQNRSLKESCLPNLCTFNTFDYKNSIKLRFVTHIDQFNLLGRLPVTFNYMSI